MSLAKPSLFFTLLVLCFLGGIKGTQAQQNLYGPAPVQYSDTSHLVSSTFFHWYASTGGQLTGPWRPVEGRPNWTGLAPWWKTQIKQVMAANIDVLYVHLIPSTEIRRILFFQALSEMRAEGYDVPKVAPFLDPLITWDNRPNVDLATTAGKDSVAAQYIRFYTQYFTQNTDPHAADYIAYIDGKPILDTWHVFLNMDNVDSMKREDLASRLSAAFGSVDGRFNNGIHMITTAINNPVYSFADERVAQFEINVYNHTSTHNGIKSVQLKAGYWDQNVRTPGDFLPRDGGVHFKNAWNQIDNTVNRVYVESWNEYDEGTGIYAGDVGAPYLHLGSNNTNTDTWSTANNPYEYIETNARGAAKFNDYPRLDARFLWNDIPTQMAPNAMHTAQLTVRNEGNEMWSNVGGFSLKQSPSDPVQFAMTAGSIIDTLHDIPTFGGIFRGRPISFNIPIMAPLQTGNYDTHWQMTKGDTVFGEEITLSIEVSGNPVSMDGHNLLNNSLLHPVNIDPVNGMVLVNFELSARAQDLELTLYNLMGKKLSILAKGPHTRGSHSVTLDTQSLNAGVYLCVLDLPNGKRLSRKMFLK